jgi:hypothetical protein
MALAGHPLPDRTVFSLHRPWPMAFRLREIRVSQADQRPKRPKTGEKSASIAIFPGFLAVLAIFRVAFFRKET